MVKGQALPLSDRRANPGPPDSYMILKEKESSIPEAIRQNDRDSWADIPVLLEFKKIANDALYYDMRLRFQSAFALLANALPRV